MAPTAASSAPKKTAARKTAAHPPYLSMIQEAIKAHPEAARQGVSRPAIKKWIATTYKIDFSSAANVNNLSNAIKRGADTAALVLPKGISGCVKLAPKAKAAANKENVAPKKPVAAKKAPAKKPATKKAPAKKAATAVKKATPAKKAAASKKAAAAKAKATPAKKAAPKKKAAAAAK